jgi:signal transduction histidine kinase
VNKLLQSVVSALAEIAAYQFVSLFQVKADGLWLMAQYGYVPDQIPNHASLEEGLMGKVVRSGQPILVRNATPETSFIQSPPRIRSAIGVPVLAETQVQGLLIVETGIEEPLDIEDLNLLVGVSQQMSVGLDNARLYSDLARALEDEKQTQAQLVQAAKLGALGRLTASLAHEINNPLQSVQGCLTLAQEELDDQRRPEKMERYLAVANAEIERISGIVHNMREFYRPAQTDLRATDIHAILQNVVELTSKQLQHNHIAFQRSWADNLPRIEANPDHLKQVFLNLVLNAIDSMPDGGMLTITTASGAIASSNGRPPLPAVRIDVRDTGNGMSPETMSRLFEPFFTTKPSGSGLGLPVSYGIIRAHGGIITVASEERRGSLFTILLPVRQLAQEDTSAADHESSTLPEGA